MSFGSGESCVGGGSCTGEYLLHRSNCPSLCSFMTKLGNESNHFCPSQQITSNNLYVKSFRFSSTIENFSSALYQLDRFLDRYSIHQDFWVSVEESIELVESRGKILDRSRISWGFYWEKKKESSIEMNLLRICWEAVGLEGKEFFILFKGKNTRR